MTHTKFGKTRLVTACEVANEMLTEMMATLIQPLVPMNDTSTRNLCVLFFLFRLHVIINEPSMS